LLALFSERGLDQIMIAILQASKDSIGQVSKILTDAAIWLQEIKKPLWPPEEVSVEALAQDLFKYYICYVEGKPAGTLRYQLEDPDFWPEITDDKSAFIHKLAVDRNFAGKGISTTLLQWAVDTTRSIGRQFLRVDFDPTRKSLKKLYEGFGFVFDSSKDMRDFFVHRYVYRI